MFGTRSQTHVCIPCRNVARDHGARTCPDCREPMTAAGIRWRPPRRSDNAAWKRLAAGQWNTEPARRRGGTGVPYTFTGPTDVEPTPPRRPRKPDYSAVLATLTDDPYSPASRALATHPHANIRALVADQPRVPEASLVALIRDTDARVAYTAAGHADLPDDPALRRRLARSPHHGVRMVLAARPDTDARLLRRLLSDTDPRVAQIAAEHPATRIRDLNDIPLTWIPAARDTEVAADDHQARILAKLRDVDTTITLRDARTLLATLT